jgi:hypothetical protein
MRTQLKTLVVCFIVALATLPAFAQIQKGSYTLGGDVGLNAYLQRGNVYNITNINASVSPSVGKFLTDKWLVGVRPLLATIVENGNYAQSASTLNIQETKGNFTRFGVELSSRYYVKTTGKLNAFGFANASYARALSYNYYKPYSGGDITEENINGNFLNYQAGLGANYFLKPDVAVEATLSYAHAEVPYSNLSFTTGQVLASENIALNFSMNNFIGSFAKTDKEETPQYIKRGRQTLGGNASFLRTKPKDLSAQTFIQVHPQFSQFVTNKLRVMGEMNLFRNLGDKATNSLTFTAAARYYLPIKNRFFLHPQFGYTYQAENLTGFRSNGIYYFTDNFKHTAELSFGGSYFLTQNIALEATFLQTKLYFRDKGYSENQSLRSILGLGNVGLTYFIR